jgi:hypothetical protein
MNEGSGAVTLDSCSKGNDGALVNSPIWTTGKYESALNFNGSSYVKVNNSQSINISGAITFSAWIKANSINKYGQLIVKEGTDVYSGVFSMRVDSSNTLTVRLSQGGSIIGVTSGPQITSADAWYNVVFTYDGVSQLAIYVNGSLVQYSNGKFSGLLDASSKSLLIGQREAGDMAFDGIIDEVRIYNRSLSAREVAALYQLPDPVSITNYYNYQDLVTNNTMLIHIDNPNEISDNSTLVTCTAFFVDNKLVFQANNSATVNVWTNLGRPAYSTGFWNSQNYTTTLMLDTSRSAEINWNTYSITTYSDAKSGVSPSNVTVPYGGDKTFDFNSSQGYGFDVAVDGESQGQIGNYTFINVRATHTVNVTSALLKFTITAAGDLGSTISPSGNVSVGYHYYQAFSIQNKTGFNITHVFIDNVDKGVLFNYTFSNVTENHLIYVYSNNISSNNSSTPTPNPSPSLSSGPLITPAATPTSTPVPSQAPEQTNSPSPTPTSQPETNQFSTGPIAIALTAAVILIAGFALAFKEGYIKLEVADEERREPVENENECGREEGEEIGPDYSI